jgi:hypothetical protein
MLDEPSTGKAGRNHPNVAEAPLTEGAAGDSGSSGQTVLTGAQGCRYERIEGKPQTALDQTFARLGYRSLSDLAILPVLDGSVVRAYRADDGTAVAAVVLRADRVASPRSWPCSAGKRSWWCRRPSCWGRRRNGCPPR